MKNGSIGRRDFIIGTGTAAIGLGMGGMVRKAQAGGQTCELHLPLPAAAIDPETVRQYAYNHYFQGGCMHGAASGLMQAFKERFEGEDTGWDLLPYGMYRYGSGGVAGWGTICGVLNGVMAVLNLLELHGSLGNEIMGWYATTLFPTEGWDGFTAVKGDGTVLFTAIPDDEVRARTVSDSPLCHMSISKWCHAAGVSLADATEDGLNYKQDRCSKVCAETAAKAAELINEYLVNGSIEPAYETPEHFEDCLACHSVLKDQVGKMDCTGCHTGYGAVLVGTYHPNVRNGSKKRR